MERFSSGKGSMVQVLRKNAKERKSRESKYERFIDFLRDANQTKFTGYIKVNFTQGQIGRIEKFEEILKS